MAIQIIKQIPSSEDIFKEFSLSEELQKNIKSDRLEIMNILAGIDKRLLVIIGPCSAWPYDSTIEYAQKLKSIEAKVKKQIKLIMRVYTQKPRTTTGWTGPISQPDPSQPADFVAGIRYTRSLMLKILEMGLPIANEAMFTHDSMKFFPDLLSWMAIGARSTEDQEHRIYASSVDCPVGMKNPTSGSVEIGVNSVIAAQGSHTAIFQGFQIQTSGNPYAHLVLRGGSNGPNYSINDILKAKKLMNESGVTNPAIVIDVSHDNCKINGKKDITRQIEIVQETIQNRKINKEAKEAVKGFMIESFLKAGSQKIDCPINGNLDLTGLSVTDPCLGWEETEKLLINLVENF
mgnify:CR=1 FL=1